MNKIRTFLLNGAVFLACCFMAGFIWVLWPFDDEDEPEAYWI